MRLGISFIIPAVFETDIWELPKPSQLRRLSSISGKTTINVLYHFEYPPQSWREWQRVASIKVQIKKRFTYVIFNQYSGYDTVDCVYLIAELGEYFKVFIKFPKPYYPFSKDEIYQRLCVHAKRLCYEELFYIEQLIATSIRFSLAFYNKAELRQIIKRAISAYKWAHEHKSEWKTKLTREEKHKVLSNAAKKSAMIRSKDKKDKKELALKLKSNGVSLKNICKELGISRTTLWRLINN